LTNNKDKLKAKESWRIWLELGAISVYPGHGKPFSWKPSKGFEV